MDELAVQHILLFIAVRERTTEAAVRRMFGLGYTYQLALDVTAPSGWRDAFGAPPR